MNEAKLLEQIAAMTRGSQPAFVRVGPGDDCAVVDAGGIDLLLKVDQLIEHRHFRAGTAWDLVARKALGRSISDFAAMAGTPLCALATGCFPAGFDDRQAASLVEHIHRAGMKLSCPVVGGDLASSARTDDPIVLTVSVIGRPHPQRGAVLRNGAMVGDGVYVTGAVGGSFDRATGLGHHLTFTPRIAEATALATLLDAGLTAMMDVSDGVGRDAGRIAAASGVKIELEAQLLPLRAGADWTAAVGDGEDYELLFTARGAVPDRVLDTPVTRIGRVCQGGGCVIREPSGRWIPADQMGWNHA